MQPTAWPGVYDVQWGMPTIMLTALTAILALIPLTQSPFWAPMAVAIMGGLFVATVLDWLALPALYVAWFRIQPPPTVKAHEG